MKSTILLLLAFVSFSLYGQNREIDSLTKQLSKSKNDTNKVNLFFALGSIYEDNGEFFKSRQAYKNGLVLSQKTNWEKGIALANKKIANTYHNEGRTNLTITYFERALLHAQKAKNLKLEASIHHEMGMMFSDLGDVPRTLDHYYKALKIRESINDFVGVSLSYCNLGIVYTEKGDFDKAIDFLEKSLALATKNDKKNIAAYALGNLGIVYSEKGEFDKALHNYERCLKINREVGDIEGESMSLNNIGLAYRDKKAYDLSMKYTLESLHIKEMIGDPYGTSICNMNIGEIYFLQNKPKEAISFAEKSLKQARAIDFLMTVSNAADLLSRIYKKQGNGMKALEMFELSVRTRDSIASDDALQASIQKDMQYNFDKKQLADSLRVADERKMSDLKLKQEKTQSYFLYGGLILVLLFAGFLFNRFRLEKKQKLEIEHHKNLVEEKNKEITDSITYAKRLQEAILPSSHFVDSRVAENFILYRPKDIVAGDFYWAEEREGKFYIAAADSTGHGVPGAMVSVVCSNALNRAVLEYKLTTPGEILDKTRELVIETFDKSNDNVKDGMDISLLCYDTISGEISWAGANNSLWYIHDGSLNEIKADKQPIGKTEYAKPFTTHLLDWQKGTTFYLFTDGFADQFGGPKGKKFKYKPLQDLLLSIQDLSLKKQAETLTKTLSAWQGDLEQVDDVCILGLNF